MPETIFVSESLDRKIHYKMLLFSVAVAFMVCYSQIRGSRMLLLGSLMLFLVLVCVANKKNMIMPILLFFLPWSTLLKLSVGSTSFFTIALLISCLFCFVNNKLKLKLYQVILPSIILILTLIGKGIFDNPISNSYICFIIMLLLFPCITDSGKNMTDFRTLTIFFALGIITSAISAQQVAGYPNISQFIKVDAYLNITRLSGYYSDPNFYSAHITACLAGILVLLAKRNRRTERILLLLIAFVLVYCGLLSASKSFVIVTAGLFLVWIPILQVERESNGKWGIFLGLIIAVLVVVSSNAFQDLLKVIDTRFAYASTVSDLTTGRTDLWKRYFEEFLNNPLLAFIGEGYSNVNIDYRASHNTIIQGIFQFGIIGFPFVIAWMHNMLKNIKSKVQSSKIRFSYAVLMLIGVVLPWMAIDILFFDEFFLLSAYATMGVISATSSSILPEDNG